ncbi:conserved hypothetical protein [Candidatus Sulfopaludibacter sp. SbA3]|nr:conserved hypothetical protein [Candidatus Sulfopaludibacter sp. SbA3]
MGDEPLKPSEKFEQQIRRLHELLEQPGSEVTWNDRLPDPDNPSQPRQIDVTIKRDGKLTLVECRIHNDRQDVQWIEELIGRRLSFRADAVIAVSASGFTKGAILKAKSFGIILRDFSTLTEEEISAWGHLTHVSLTFHQFREVALTYRFFPDQLGDLNVDQVEESLRSTHNHLYRVLDFIAKLAEEADPPKGMACVLDAEIGEEGLRIANRPVMRIGVHASVLRRETTVRIPSVVAYDAPSVQGIDRKAFVEKVDLGEFEITSSANEVIALVDLSAIEAPVDAKLYSVNLEFDRVVRMRGLEIITPPKFRIQLRDLLLRIRPFGP